MPRNRVYRKVLMNNASITSTTTFTTGAEILDNATDVRLLLFNGLNKSVQVRGATDVIARGTFATVGNASTMAAQSGYALATSTGGGTVANLGNSPLRLRGGSLRFTITASSAPTSTGRFHAELQITREG